MRVLLDCDGSLEYALTWKRRAMPLGQSICALRAVGRPISDSGCTGWPTPNVPNGGRVASEESMTSTGRKPDGRKGQVDLGFVAQLAGWPTPDAQGFGVTDSRWEERREECKARLTNGNGFGLTLGMAAQLAGWPTCKSSDSHNGMRTTEGALKEFERKGSGSDLPTMATLAGWATPDTGRHEDLETFLARQKRMKIRHPDKGMGTPLGIQAQMASGATSTPSPAGTAKSGALNAAHSRWLMGYPREWCIAAIRAHRSIRARRGKRGR